MNKWENKVVQSTLSTLPGSVRNGDGAEVLANNLGKEGWELVNAVGTGSSAVITMFFKRQLKRAYNMKNRGKRGKK